MASSTPTFVPTELLETITATRIEKWAEVVKMQEELHAYLADKPAPKQPVHNYRGDLLEQGVAPPDEVILEVQRRLFKMDLVCYQNGLPMKCYNLEQMYKILALQTDLEGAPLPPVDWVPVSLDTLEKLNAEYRQWLVKESGEFTEPIRSAPRPDCMVSTETRRIRFKIDKERHSLNMPLRFHNWSEFMHLLSLW